MPHQIYPEAAKAVPNLAIIGGGASGTMVAVRLLRDSGAQFRITILEPRERPGLGVAYSTRFDSHVLNVPAGRMSALPEKPDHFLNWLRANGIPSAAATQFVPRPLYGAYLRALLGGARGNGRAGVEVAHVRAQAVRLSTDGHSFVIVTDDREVIAADGVVLALGNLTARNPLPQGSLEPLGAWSPGAADGIEPDATVVLIGAGLTAVDICMSLRQGGHRGVVYLVSRHGLMPQVHATGPSTAARLWDGFSGSSIRALLAKVRSAAREELRAGGTWQGCIDSLRPHTQKIWRELSLIEKQRFLRHLRPFWDIHRHRTAPEVFRIIESMRAEGRLRVIAGRITSAAQGPSGAIEVKIASRGANREMSLIANRLINCTGPESDIRRMRVPLLQQMVADGLARYDDLFLGLDTTADGAIVSKDGAASSRMFAIGPMLRGALWETTAMPEIRTQAANIARMLIKHLSLTEARATEAQADSA